MSYIFTYLKIFTFKIFKNVLKLIFFYFIGITYKKHRSVNKTHWYGYRKEKTLVNIFFFPERKGNLIDFKLQCLSLKKEYTNGPFLTNFSWKGEGECTRLHWCGNIQLPMTIAKTYASPLTSRISHLKNFRTYFYRSLKKCNNIIYF